MAFSPKFVCLFFLLITLSYSLQTHARDAHFFSKATRTRDPRPTTTKDDEFVHLNKQDEQEQQPTFIPQTTETGGYGLYGHETGLNSPSTTTTSLYNLDENNNNNNNNNNNKYDNFNNNNNNKYDNFNNNNNNNYDESNFNFNNNNNNNNNYENFKYDNYYKNTNENHEKNYAPELKGLSGSSTYLRSSNNNNNINNNGGVEKQGMSDTRFLENGRYFYDVDAENNFGANNNYMSSYSNNYNNNNNNNYNANGYYGNNENNYEKYYNNYNKKNNFYSESGAQGYQNQVPEEEFDFDQP